MEEKEITFKELMQLIESQENEFFLTVELNGIEREAGDGDEERR